MLATTFAGLLGKYTEDAAHVSLCWDELSSAYGGPQRYYHNWGHLQNMFGELEAAAQPVLQMDSLLLAVFYHDVVYEPSRNDNEAKSAALFEKRLGETSFPFVAHCAQQIVATKTHLHSPDADTNLLLDLDLSILGKQRSEYMEYARNIRKEYGMYPDILYQKGRKKVLEHFLHAGPIYKTAYFQDKYEENARNNLAFEYNRL
jgi:predicted metal-dependent HD superfamily phosphohydrolase